MAVRRQESLTARSRNQTRALELRERIEEEIATGLLMPGSRLDETALAERFGMSRTPVREALIQLTSTGMLEMWPWQGAVVPDVPPHRLVEMFEVMAGLEAMCGRLAARRLSEAEQEELLGAHKACEAALQSHDADAYYRQNEIFHHVIYKASHNSFLAEQASTLHKRLRPYRRLQLRVRDRMRTSFAEHQRIVDAISAGNGELAGESLHTHVLVQGEKFSDLIASLHWHAARVEREALPSPGRRSAARRARPRAPGYRRNTRQPRRRT